MCYFSNRPELNSTRQFAFQNRRVSETSWQLGQVNCLMNWVLIRNLPSWGVVGSSSCFMKPIIVVFSLLRSDLSDPKETVSGEPSGPGRRLSSLALIQAGWSCLICCSHLARRKVGVCKAHQFAEPYWAPDRAGKGLSGADFMLRFMNAVRFGPSPASKTKIKRLPWHPAVKTLPMQEVQVPSPVRELRSHTPHGPSTKT